MKFLKLLACAYGELVGNGMCNDEANIAECIYDGGDCCTGCINTDLCSECLCYEESALLFSYSCMYCFPFYDWISFFYLITLQNNFSRSNYKFMEKP